MGKYEGANTVVAGRLLLDAWSSLSDGTQSLQQQYDAYTEGILAYMQALVETSQRSVDYTPGRLVTVHQSLVKLDSGAFELLARFMLFLSQMDTGEIAARCCVPDRVDELREIYGTVKARYKAERQRELRVRDRLSTLKSDGS